jgi:hypothetical protein
VLSSDIFQIWYDGKTMTISIYRMFLALFCAVIVASGCAIAPRTPILMGPAFQFQENVETEMAQIYVYRMISPPTMVSPDVMINGKKYFDLQAGGFGKALTSPGEISIETKWPWITTVENRLVRFLAEPNQTYFVKCHIDMWGSAFYPTLKVVPKAIGLYELEELKEVDNLSNR